MSVRILTDSCADFTREELSSYNIRAVALQTIFGEETFLAGETLDRDVFWNRLIAGENPTTSQPSTDSFMKVFEEIKESGDEAVYIAVSSGISGTMQGSVLARSMVECDKLHIVDSNTATAAQKILVITACRLRDEGKTAAEIVAAVEELLKRVHVFAGVDTLEYLARGGRISKAAASIGTLAQLKPLVYMSEEGKVDVFTKAIGRHRAIDTLCKKIESLGVDPAYPIIPIYSYNTENCEAFLKKLDKAGIPYNREAMTELGATIATHIGPNLYGLCFVRK
ncbi:MAG: DegV family protein [Clostridia bacterium]|nr:DegV family protein [Clostridia bacterium]